MEDFDPSLFADIADAVGLSSPAFIEKDFYAVQLLKCISELQLSEYKFIFAGGTCLAKAHFPTFRMSEDLDLKLHHQECFFKLSDSKKRKYRSELNELIIHEITKTQFFKLAKKESMSEGRYKCFYVNYPKTHKHNSLRPELKLEFTEIIDQSMLHITAPIGSIYADIMKQPQEILTLSCDPIEVILVEKFIALLRRTAEVSREYSDNDDETLVRHVYDLYLIKSQNCNISKISELFKHILNQDVNKFGMRHYEFKNAPIGELLYGLNILTSEAKFKNRYKSFLGPLVYNSNPPSWEQGIEYVYDLSKSLLHK